MFSFLRALCAIAIGLLLVRFRDDMVEWMTVAIGVLFFVSGLIAVVVAATSHPKQLGEQVAKQSHTGTYILATGSMLLGVVLALMPGTFVQFLVQILALFLIIGAVSQFVTLGTARALDSVGCLWWVAPVLLLLFGLVALLKPTAVAAAPLLIIGWCMVFYGVISAINAVKAHRCRKHAEHFYSLNQKPDFTNAEVVEPVD